MTPPWRHRRPVRARPGRIPRTRRRPSGRFDKEVVRRDKENARLASKEGEDDQGDVSSESLRLHREVRILRCPTSGCAIVGPGRRSSRIAKNVRSRRRCCRSCRPRIEAAQLRAAWAVAASEGDRGAAQERPSAPVRDWRPGKRRWRFSLRFARSGRHSSPSLPGGGQEGERCPADADLRRALRRSRRQKATIKSLRRKGAKTSRNRICKSSLRGFVRPGRCCRGRSRPQERQQDKGLGTQARPAARRARPRPHPAARARSAPMRRLRPVRAALNGAEESTLVRQGLQARDPPSALAPDLRGSVGAPGAAAVPQDALFWALSTVPASDRVWMSN